MAEGAVLEYLIRVAGAAVAGAEVAGVRREFVALGDAAAHAGEKSAVSSGKLTGGLAAIGKLGAGLGLALGAVGVKAVGMSNQFQTEMLKIRTEGGATSKEFTRMRGAVLDLASSGQSMGQGPVSLAQGLYHLESMGLRGSRAILGLKLASEEAAISGASLEDTTTSLGGAIFIAAKGTDGLKGAMGSLNAIAGAGNMRFQDLNEALGTGLLGSAKLAHVSLQEIGAALAVLTDSGYRASSAGAQLGTALHYLYAPTSKGQKALEAIGLSGNRMAADLRKPQGLLTALRDLRTHMEGLGKDQQQQVLNNLLPGGHGRVLLNLYELQNRLGPKYQQIQGTRNDFGQHVLEQQSNPATRLAEATARADASMVKFGDVLTKYLTPALIFIENGFAKLVGVLTQVPGAVRSIVTWFQKNSAVAQALGTFIGILVVGFGAWKLAVLAATAATRGMEIAMAILNAVMDANPIALIIVGIAALAAAFVLAYRRVGWFRDGVNAVFSWMKTAVVTVVGFFVKTFNQIVTFIKNFPKMIATAAKGMWDGLKTGLIDVVNFIIARINNVIDAINSVDAVNIFGSRIGAPRIGHLGALSTGHQAHQTTAHKTGTRGLPPIIHANAIASPVHVHQHTGDIVVKVGSHEMARMTRESIRDAMMSAA